MGHAASGSSYLVEGSGIAASESRDVPPFASVKLVGSNDVEINVGGQTAVVVYADDNLLERVTTEVHSGTLEIGNKPGSITTRAPMRVEVGVPALDGVNLAGSGAISATGVDAESFSVALGGSGVVRAAGRADRLEVALTGSGDAELDELVARDVNAQVNGSGRAAVTATEKLTAAVPGSGVILYGGDPPDVTTNVPGTGAIVRR